MKNLEEELIKQSIDGNCTPQISVLAKRMKEPAATLHYNIKKMERENKILKYKAVFDYTKINRGFCTYVLINLSPDEYSKPERIAHELLKFGEVESIDILSGDWELIIKVRTNDIKEYYEFVKSVLSRKGITKVKSLSSLNQIKSEFVAFDNNENEERNLENANTEEVQGANHPARFQVLN